MRRRARPEGDPLSRRRPTPAGAAPVDESALAPYNSYGEPEYVVRGYYVDVPFRCASCGTEQVWTARQQKWWYETAKGYVYSTARLCRPCRRREQARRAQARRAAGHGTSITSAARAPSSPSRPGARTERGRRPS